MRERGRSSWVFCPRSTFSNAHNAHRPPHIPPLPLPPEIALKMASLTAFNPLAVKPIAARRVARVACRRVAVVVRADATPKVCTMAQCTGGRRALAAAGQRLAGSRFLEDGARRDRLSALGAEPRELRALARAQPKPLASTSVSAI